MLSDITTSFTGVDYISYHAFMLCHHKSNIRTYNDIPPKQSPRQP